MDGAKCYFSKKVKTMRRTSFFHLFPVVFLVPSGILIAQTAGSAPLFSYTRLWPVHMVLMSLSFAHLLAGTIVSAFMKKKKWRLALHRRLQWTGGISGIAGLAIALCMVSVSSGLHFRILHSIIGLIGIVLIVSELTAGLLIFGVSSGKKKAFRLVHRWLGRFTLALLAVVIVSGLRIAGVF
ncbi:MAG: hypothetical protein JXQ30_07395 [Spirochaetes bacterium]|nr:hypothetical protein [Spirochaetota bacterium]